MTSSSVQNTLTAHQKARLALRYWLIGARYFRAASALDFAEHYHNGLRKDGLTPEFAHQVQIAQHIKTIKGVENEEACIAAALLHDVVEDYGVSEAEIRNLFGEEIAGAVMVLSKIVHSHQKSDADYYDAIATNPIASIVKGADRANNLQSMQGVFTAEKQRQYIDETRRLVLPMLKRARRTFPSQEPAYLNIKLMLVNQIQLLEYALQSRE